MALMQFTLGFVIANIVILFWILVIQARNVRVIRSPFTVGLLVFILVFLIQNIVAAFFYITMMSYYADGLDLPVFVLTVMQTIAFLIFLWITRK